MKTSYVIDGYNLLHAMGLLIGKVAPKRLERARTTLLDNLAETFGDDASLVTVVFDAAAAPPGSSPEQHHHGVRVLFALGGPEADDLIEDLISLHEHPRQLCVVSNDHRLQRAARRRHAQPTTCDEFLNLMEERLAPPPAAEAETPEKEQPSPDDTAHWLEEFGHLQQELDRFDRVTKIHKLPPGRRGKPK